MNVIHFNIPSSKAFFCTVLSSYAYQESHETPGTRGFSLSYVFIFKYIINENVHVTIPSTFMYYLLEGSTGFSQSFVFAFCCCCSLSNEQTLHVTHSGCMSGM